MAKINSKFEENKKTLALILAKLINPTAVQHDGFGAPPIRQTPSPSEVITSITNITDQSSISTPANNAANNSSVSHANTDGVSTPANNTANNSIASDANTSGVSTLAKNTANDSIASDANTRDVSTPANNTADANTSGVSILANNTFDESIVSDANTSGVSTLANNTVDDSVVSDANTSGDDSIVSDANTSGISTDANNTADDSIVSDADTSGVSTPANNCTNDSTVSGANTSTPIRSNFGTASISGIIDPGRVLYLRRRSCSRRNFSAKLNQEVFDVETRKKSNVAGKLGKMKLNPVLVDYIKSLTFQHFPLEPDQTKKHEWAQCVIAIDACNRGLNKKVAPVPS